MVEHNAIILKHLNHCSDYKKMNLSQDSIINKKNFGTKQFENMCLSYFEVFMGNFYSRDSFQVRLLDLPSINGAAFQSRNTRYSVIHWGTISLIYETALKLTEDKQFFSNCFSNNNWAPISENDISLEDKTEYTKYRKIYLCGTNDQTRRELAGIIARFSWLSTVFHEAGHILHGHIDFLDQRLAENILLMSYDNTGTDNNAIIRRVLEKDADEFAGNRIMEHTFNNKLYSTFYSDVVKNQKELLEVVAAGITLKFLLYGISHNSSSLYLPNAYRIITILDAGFSNLKYNNLLKIEINEYHDTIVQGIRNTILAFNNRFPSKVVDEKIFIEQLLVGSTDNTILKAEWNEIRPILDGYKHERIQLPSLFQ